MLTTKESGADLQKIEEKSLEKKDVSPKNTNQKRSKTPPKRTVDEEKRLLFSTAKLEESLKDKRTRDLVTESQVSDPTQSTGFDSPEDYRLTHSTIDKKEKSPKSRTKKDS